MPLTLKNAVASIIAVLAMGLTRHYEVSDCLIVGTDDEGLASMFLSRLRVE